MNGDMREGDQSPFQKFEFSYDSSAYQALPTVKIHIMT